MRGSAYRAIMARASAERNRPLIVRQLLATRAFYRYNIRARQLAEALDDPPEMDEIITTLQEVRPCLGQ